MTMRTRSQTNESTTIVESRTSLRSRRTSTNGEPPRQRTRYSYSNTTLRNLAPSPTLHDKDEDSSYSEFEEESDDDDDDEEWLPPANEAPLYFANNQPYDVAIDFDEASRAWRANKRSLPGGGFEYRTKRTPTTQARTRRPPIRFGDE